jgi:hypothetical protein
MREWDYTRKNAIECRYEDLIADSEADLFGKIVAELGFESDEIALCRTVFKEHLVFDANGERTDRASRVGSHVRSGRTGQWKDVFDDVLAREFVRRFGNVLVELGYEPDNSWCERVRKTSVGKIGESRANSRYRSGGDFEAPIFGF